MTFALIGAYKICTVCPITTGIWFTFIYICFTMSSIVTRLTLTCIIINPEFIKFKIYMSRHCLSTHPSRQFPPWRQGLSSHSFMLISQFFPVNLNNKYWKKLSLVNSFSPWQTVTSVVCYEVVTIMGIETRTWNKIFYLGNFFPKEQWIYLPEEHSSMSVSHISPVYPGIQEQVKLLMSSVQVELCLQGLS